MSDIESVNALEFYGSYRVVYDDGSELFVPIDVPSNRHSQQVMDWLADGGTITPFVLDPAKLTIRQRTAPMAEGGYGTLSEQFEMIGEQGLEVYQAHIAKVKSDIPKETNGNN